MKKTNTSAFPLVFCFLGLAFHLFGQGVVSNSNQNFSSLRNLEPSAEPRLSYDFNFEFYPVSRYLRITKQAGFDSLTQTFKILRDTAKSNTLVSVFKEGDLLTIKNLQSVSSPVYSARIEFLGLSRDGKGSLIYRAKTRERETIVINPVYGWVLLFFEVNCGTFGRKPNDCDSYTYYFGLKPTTVEELLEAAKK